MASPATNSSRSPPVQTSGSDEDLLNRMDERKRKRMLSNRESAKRSRMRKQKRLNDLTTQITQLKEENGQILAGISATAERYAKVASENSVLTAQMMELSQRLQSLNEIIDFINSSSSSTAAAATTTTTTGNCMFEADEFQHQGFGDCFWNSNPWNSGGFNQHPIVASADVFDY